jgi:hypothetical protein
MITLTNFSSGELLIAITETSIRLTREQANRLILFARMHTVDQFIAELPQLIPNLPLARSIAILFESAQSSSQRWGLKEKFARLITLAKGYQPKNQAEVAEVVTL